MDLLSSLPSSQFSSMKVNFVQILVFENHWITIYGPKDLNEISVYDSLNYAKDKKYPKKIIKSFAKMINSTSSQLKVNIMSVQQQQNTIDCGLFATAFATDLLYGNSSSNVLFYTSIKKCDNTCLSVSNKISSHYFQEQMQKLARQEVLHTSFTF